MSGCLQPLDDMGRRLNFVYNALLGNSVKIHTTPASFSIQSFGITVHGALTDKWELSIDYDLRFKVVTERWNGGDPYGAFIHSLLIDDPIAPPHISPSILKVLYAVKVRGWRRNKHNQWVHTVTTLEGTSRVVYKLGELLQVDDVCLGVGHRAMLSGWVP